MIYEQNTTQWKIGDIVIHDSDAKERRMLMKVLGYHQDGMCVTCYLEHTKSRDARWGKPTFDKSRLINPIRVLHDPKNFGIMEAAL